MSYQNNFPVNVLMFVLRPLCKHIDPDKITLGAELRIKSAYNHISPVPGEVSGLLISIPVLKTRPLKCGFRSFLGVFNVFGSTSTFSKRNFTSDTSFDAY